MATAAVPVGVIGAFDQSAETWASYTERLEQFFLANGITDGGKKRATLLAVCGPEIYQLIRDLLSPVKPTEKSFKDLVALVKDHQEPAPSAIVERFRFFSCSQRPDESISDFLAHLHKRAKHCQFGDSLQDMLRDRLVCGCRDKRLQYKFLADPGLTYDKAVQLARSNETADRGTKDLAGTTGGPTHKLHGSKPRPPRTSSSTPKPPATFAQPPTRPKPCFRCGAAHSPATCRFKTASCNYCQKQGHIATACFKKARDQTTGEPSKKRRSTTTYQLDAEQVDSDAEPYPLYYSTTERPQPIQVTVSLNGVETQMELDTGATLSVMSTRTYNSLWPSDVRPKLTPSSARLTTYTGERIPVLGQIPVHVSYQTQKCRLSLLVVPADGPTLLGRDWLAKLQLNWHEIHQVHSPPNEPIQQVLDRYPAVFSGSLGEITVTVKDIRSWTSKDPALSKVRLMLESGWENCRDTAYTPYTQRKDELSIEDGCVLWGTRVVIPPSGREKLLDELHQGHPGISRMKSLARSFIWWPNIDKDLETHVKHCTACQQT